MLRDIGLTADECDVVARSAHVETATGLLAASARLLRAGQTTAGALRAAGAAAAPCFRPLAAWGALAHVATPFPALDALLGGGVAVGRVTEVVGTSGSGKTLLCHALAGAAARHGRRVLYVDATGASFAPRALAQWLDDADTRAVLRNVRVRRILDADSFIETLQSLLDGDDDDDDEEELWEDDEDEDEENPGLVIVDGFTALFAPVLCGAAGSIGSAVLCKAGRLLRNLARQQSRAVVVTNWMVSGVTAALHPALGEQWRAAVHTRLLIEQQQQQPAPDSTATVPVFAVTHGLQHAPSLTVVLDLLPSCATLAETATPKE